MRNPSKNTIKLLMRPANGNCAGWGMRHTNYRLFNEVGARLYDMSKGKICNRQPKGWIKYVPVKQREDIYNELSENYKGLIK